MRKFVVPLIAALLFGCGEGPNSPGTSSTSIDGNELMPRSGCGVGEGIWVELEQNAAADVIVSIHAQEFIGADSVYFEVYFGLSDVHAASVTLGSVFDGWSDTGSFPVNVGTDPGRIKCWAVDADSSFSAGKDTELATVTFNPWHADVDDVEITVAALAGDMAGAEICALTFDMVGQDVSVCLVQDMTQSTSGHVVGRIELGTVPSGGHIDNVDAWGFDTVYNSDKLTVTDHDCAPSHPWTLCVTGDHEWNGPCPFDNCRTTTMGAFHVDGVDLDDGFLFGVFEYDTETSSPDTTTITACNFVNELTACFNCETEITW